MDRDTERGRERSQVLEAEGRKRKGEGSRSQDYPTGVCYKDSPGVGDKSTRVVSIRSRASSLFYTSPPGLGSRPPTSRSGSHDQVERREGPSQGRLDTPEKPTRLADSRECDSPYLSLGPTPQPHTPVPVSNLHPDLSTRSNTCLRGARADLVPTQMNPVPSASGGKFN